MDSRHRASQALPAIYQFGTLRRAMLDTGFFKLFQQLTSGEYVLKNIPPNEVDYLAGKKGNTRQVLH